MKIKPYIFALIVTLTFLLSNSIIQSQTLINQLWELKYNYPDTVQWSSSTLDGSNLITTGNTWHNATQKVNIVTTKTDQNGNITWQTEYNGTLSGFDYGACIEVDGSGNVFIAGATHNTSSSSFDIVIIKYNSSGVQQWTTLYNGPGSGNDIPSDITLDGSGNIYVCGAATGSTTGYDYVTMKLNSSGAIQWSQTYDYASLYDIPGFIAYNSTTSKIGVAGASQSSSTNWDYTTLKYTTSGTLSNTNRSAAAGYGFDRPTGLVTDASANLYITGYAYNGTDYDMRTIKLDDDLSPLWTKTEDGGDEDGSNSICIDGSNNTYIAGFSEGDAGNKLMEVIKYNGSGVKQWTSILPNISNDINAEATAITYNSTTGRVAITGFYEYSSGKKTITIYTLNTSNGNLITKKNFPNIETSIDVPTGIKTSSHNIWVYGRRTVDDTTKYLTIKYEQYDHPTNNILDTLGNPLCRDNEFIIRFDPNLLDKNFLDNKQLTYANLIDVLEDTTYDKISPFLLGSNSRFVPKIIKIYKQFTSDDTTSISRSGRIVDVPSFWASLIVTCDSSVNELTSKDSISSFFPDIRFVNLNYIGIQLDGAEDEDYNSEQQSLHNVSPNDPNADIKVEGAWDIESGNPNIKVGIIDVTVDWRHEDFGYTTPENTKVLGGYDFVNDVNFPDMTIPSINSHATSIAGIIGALRNNIDPEDPLRVIGVAGIAGGDNSASPANRGASLYTLVNSVEDDITGEATITMSNTTEAIITGAMHGSNAYNDIDIMNMSSGFTGLPADLSNELSDALYTASKNEVVFIAARGQALVSSDVSILPASFPINDGGWVLNVGAAGDDGERKTPDNSAPGDEFFSCLGGELDLIAPGTLDQIWTTGLSTESPAYINFTNSSAAAPHVAGVAALLLSYINENGASGVDDLSPEDVEWVIEHSADDRGPDTGYDPETGNGMLNATAALEYVELPLYHIKHIDFPTYISASGSPEGEVAVYISEDLGSGAGFFTAEAYDVDFHYSHSIPASATFIDGWIRNGNAKGYREYEIPSDFTLELPDYTGSSLVSISATNATVRTRLYYITKNYLGMSITPFWYPTDLSSELGLQYSIYYSDPEFVLSTENTSIDDEIAIFPNPSHNLVNMTFPTNKQLWNIELLNLNGELLYTDNIKDGSTSYSINLSNFVNGIFVLKINKGDSTVNYKIVKI